MFKTMVQRQLTKS